MTCVSRRQTSVYMSAFPQRVYRNRRTACVQSICSLAPGRRTSSVSRCALLTSHVPRFCMNRGRGGGATFLWTKSPTFLSDKDPNEADSSSLTAPFVQLITPERPTAVPPQYVTVKRLSRLHRKHPTWRCKTRSRETTAGGW